MKKATLFIVGATALAVISISGKAQTTKWVSTAGGDGNLGTQAQPYATISWATEVAKTNGGNYIIKVIEGDYTQAHELAGGATNPGYPIIIDKSTIRIEGDDTDPEDYPRLGGDIESSSVDSIIRIVVPSNGNLSDVVLNRLTFVGEDTEGEDAPSAIHVVSESDYTTVRCGASNCIIQRSEMNDSEAEDKPMVLVEASDCSAFWFSMVDCTIWCSARGGAEVRVASGNNEGDSGAPRLLVQDTAFFITGDDEALFAMGLTNEEGATGQPGLKAFRVLVDSTAADTNRGIETGIGYWLTPSDGTSIQVFTGNSQVEGCHIKGCEGDGVLVYSHEYGTSNANIVLSRDDFGFNTIHHNGGAGIHVDWDESTGYLNVHSQNDLIYRNGTGIWYDGLNEDISGNICSHRNATIAKNTGFAFQVDGTEFKLPGEPGPELTNLIVWDNAGGSDQHGGELDWDPQVNGSMANSCWQNLSSPSNGNTNSNPNMANVAADDYHLTSYSSACIDTGNMFIALPPTDLDGEDRTVNGDAQGGSEVDMGADEYDP